MLGFALAASSALAVGVWLGVFHQFQLNDHIRIQGAPVPLVIFVHENQNWTDYVKPKPIGYICMAANTLFLVGLLELSYMLVFIDPCQIK